MGQLFSMLFRKKQETVGSNKRSSSIAQESDVSEELETQPAKRQRIMDDEQRIVIYGEEQGSLPTEQETTTGSNKSSCLIAQNSDIGEVLVAQLPVKRRRTMDEQSMVIYNLEQGCSSSSQLTCLLDWLFNNSSVPSEIMTLKGKLDRLSARQRDVVSDLKQAEIQPGQKRRAEVHHWLTEVQRIKDKIRSMIKDGEGTSSNSNPFGSIESLIAEVDELIGRSKFSNGLVLLDQDSTRVPLLLGTKPVGTNFQQNAKKIMGWLQNHKHCIIGVYGMGGVGKTTLLRHIHDQLLGDTKGTYKVEYVYWVTVSQNWSVHKMQEDIAKVLGLASFQEVDEMKRAAILHDRLAARGRTVLFLDDMWEQFSGETVGIPLDNGKCTIILDTRSCDVCREMGCKDFIIKAEILREGEAWDLFVEKLGHYDTLKEEAKKIAWDVAKECGGLPLAIATVARSMTWVDDIDEWRTVLNALKSVRGQDNMEKDVFQILRFSYDRLKDKRVQECFLSCILYGEDEEIRRTTLVDLWINEGLLDEWGSRDTQVAKGHTILNKLENSCLLESCRDFAEEKCVKMHDLIRDMAIIITKKDPVFMAGAKKMWSEVPEEEQWRKDLVKVSLSRNNIKWIPSGMAPVTPSLTVLMLNANYILMEIPNSFFEHMRALTLLDLSYTGIMRVPESVSDLENLRGLLLFNCQELTYVPSLAKLTKLRTLDLERCCKLKEAPSGIERLESVEKLSVAWDGFDLIRFNKVVRSLTSLIGFRIIIRVPKNSSEWGSVSNTDMSMQMPRGKYHDEWDLFYRYSLSPNLSAPVVPKNDNMMLICGGEYGGILAPATCECLVIRGSEMKGTSLGDVFHSMGEAKGLREIDIDDCKGLECIFDSSGTQQGSSLLCSTQKLNLKRLTDIRRIAKLSMPHSFSQLHDLHIIGCPKLKVVVPVTCTKQLLFPNLESFIVKGCEELEEIFESSEATLSSNPIHSLPNLSCLILHHLPKLKVIFPLTKELHLPNLKFFIVRCCDEVEEIFDSSKATLLSNPILSLPNLMEITLSCLPKIKVIFPFTKELHLPNLERIRLLECEEVEGIFKPGYSILQPPILSLPNLERLFLTELPKIKVILPFTEEIHLPKLDGISVSQCEEVEEIFETNKGATPSSKSNPILSLPNFKSLYLEDLPELGSIYRGRLLCDTSLHKPLIINCPKLKWWRLPGGGLTSDEPLMNHVLLKVTAS